MVGIPAILAPGGSLTVNETTANRGRAPARASRTAYLLSLDAVRSASDIQFGTRAVVRLRARRSSRASAYSPYPRGRPPGNSVDSRLTRYSSVGTQLVDDDDSGIGFCSLIDGTGGTPLDAGAANLPAGTCLLQVRASASASASSGVFDYRLQLTTR